MACRLVGAKPLSKPMSGTNFSENLIKINTFSFNKNAFENVVWKMAAICLGLNELMSYLYEK